MPLLRVKHQVFPSGENYQQALPSHSTAENTHALAAQPYRSFTAKASLCGTSVMFFPDDEEV